VEMLTTSQGTLLLNRWILEEQGFDKAFVVLGQFLLIREGRGVVHGVAEGHQRSTTRNAASCSQCLSEWWDAFL
uniref:Uncharacterized protein n=1 Tax=Salmo trutta TaxID=8032 RepID=A0A674B203_SALTR